MMLTRPNQHLVLGRAQFASSVLLRRANEIVLRIAVLTTLMKERFPTRPELDELTALSAEFANINVRLGEIAMKVSDNDPAPHLKVI
jgi:hypothetical protein